MFTITKSVDVSLSDKGSVWKQLTLSFLVSLPFFTHGIESSTLFSSAHSGHFINVPEDITWSTTAMILGAAVSAPIYCFLIDRFGRKTGIYIVSLMQGASCIPVFLEPNEITLIILHTLAGISTGGLFTVLPIYIREINTDINRGWTVAFTLMMTTAGYLVRMVMTDEGMLYTKLGLVVVQVVTVIVLLESPSYLVLVGKIEAAKTNMAKLKCLPDNDQIVSKEISALRDESERAKSNGKLTLYAIFKNKIYRDCTKIGLGLNTTMALCGSIVFLNQDKALLQLRTSWDPEGLLVLSCMFAGSLTSVVAIRFLERKYVISFGYTIMMLSMGVLAVYTQSDLTVNTLRSVPVVALGVLVYGYGITWGLPIVSMVEIFNIEIRAKMLGVLFTYYQIIKLAQVHAFPHVEEYVGVYTLLYMFAGVNLFGAVYALFIMPDIRDKTVRQIERQLKRVPLLKL